jgi:hypothetical protein
MAGAISLIWRFHHANYIDCFGRAFSARRWGLGIFSLAALSAWMNARFDEHRAALQSPYLLVVVQEVCS